MINASIPQTPVAVILADATLLAWLPAIAMFMGIATLGLVMMVFFNRRERQLKAITSQINNDLEEARALRAQLDEAHATASTMMVTAQRLAARLDERVAALDMASLRMNATRNALPRPANTIRSRTASAAALDARSVPGNGSRVKTASEESIALSPVLSSIASAMAPAPAAAAAGVASPARASMEMKPVADAFMRKVCELADAGQSSVAIARDLNEQVGKVELVLALRGR